MDARTLIVDICAVTLGWADVLVNTILYYYVFLASSLTLFLMDAIRINDLGYPV